MDPLSMTASVIAILELTSKLTGYINDVRRATKEQGQVAIEASNLYSLLTSIRFRVEEARSGDPWFNQVKLLGVENGLLDQFKSILEKMVDQISIQYLHRVKDCSDPFFVLFHARRISKSCWAR